MIDVESVGALIRAISRYEVLARFRTLTAGQIHAKPTATDPHDIVTIADLEAERRLTAALTALLPGSVVVGEEGVAANPALLSNLGQHQLLWLVDPLDGTQNFANGIEDFGTMVALVVAGEIHSGWIYLPTRDALFAAQAGRGATLNRARLCGPRFDLAAAPRGSLYTRHMPAELRQTIEGRARGMHIVPGPGSACVEYAALARGEKDFVVYHRFLPWDHAPGALILSEAGGACRHQDGSPYRVGDDNQPTLLVRDAQIWAGLAQKLFS